MADPTNPKPTALRVLHGDRPNRINHNEPVPADGEPQRPEWFDADATAVWDEVTRQLRAMTLLHAADQDTLAVYCQAVVSWSRAAQIVQDKGPLVKGYRGEIVKNPALQIARDMGAQVRVLAHEFGLTPSGRVGKSISEKKTSAQDPARLLSS